jgi:hypothetical protein
MGLLHSLGQKRRLTLSRLLAVYLNQRTSVLLETAAPDPPAPALRSASMTALNSPTHRKSGTGGYWVSGTHFVRHRPFDGRATRICAELFQEVGEAVGDVLCPVPHRGDAGIGTKTGTRSLASAHCMNRTPRPYPSMRTCCPLYRPTVTGSPA